MIAVALTIGSLVLSVVSFIAGRAISESEKILAEKRRVYEQFLISCPRPNSAYAELSDEEIALRAATFDRAYSPLLLYASTNVALATSEYLNAFVRADEELEPASPPLHEAYKAAAKAHNDLILEMRRDALAWSAFGYRGESRLSADMLERAKRNAL